MPRRLRQGGERRRADVVSDSTDHPHTRTYFARLLSFQAAAAVSWLAGFLSVSHTHTFCPPGSASSTSIISIRFAALMRLSQFRITEADFWQIWLDFRTGPLPVGTPIIFCFSSCSRFSKPHFPISDFVNRVIPHTDLVPPTIMQVLTLRQLVAAFSRIVALICIWSADRGINALFQVLHPQAKVSRQA